MNTIIKFTSILLIFSILTSCMPEEFKKDAFEKFDDQHFKTAIALIELHHVREGNYPESLQQLKYIGDWDKMVFTSVEYKKLNSGYELNLVDRFTGDFVDFSYPADFWNGLGLVKSNVKNSSER